MTPGTDDTMDDLLRDPRHLRERLVDWLRRTVQDAGLEGVTFGLSGGVDSAVVAALCAEALGPDRCLGLIMPIESADEDARLARDVAEAYSIPTVELDLVESFHMLADRLESQVEPIERAVRGGGEPETATAPARAESQERLARSNVKPRLRMIALYYYANLLGYMVLGTGNRAEFTLGYFTKWGDGAADAFPLADLLKHEVWQLAREMGVPSEIVDRPPTAGLWTGQTDEQELGFTYAQIDRFLAAGSSGDDEVDREIERRRRLSTHKLEPAPRPDLS